MAIILNSSYKKGMIGDKGRGSKKLTSLTSMTNPDLNLSQSVRSESKIIRNEMNTHISILDMNHIESC